MGLKTQWAEGWARRASGQVVQGGPFAGLKYGRLSVNSGYAPKLLGCYEQEAAPFVEALVGRRPRKVINAGAAEGYYAVGLARRLPEAQVVAYETEVPARAMIEETAKLNGVAERVRIEGSCDLYKLNLILGDGQQSAVVVDVESYEGELLDPSKVAGLAQADILVEVHLGEDAKLEALLRERFEKTHTIERVNVREPQPDDVPEAMRAKMRWLPVSVRRKVLDEKRSRADCWLWMRAG